MTHALIAPSSAAAIVACPARVVMCAGSPPHMEGDTTVREQGTAAHWVAEQWCRHGSMPDVGTIAPNGVAVTAHMQETAYAWRAQVLAWGADAVQWETTYDIPQVPRCFGTADASAVGPDGAIYIADLKYGYRAVDVWPNHQLALYAAGVAASHAVPLSASTAVHLTIYQPRAWHRAGATRSARVTGADVAHFVQKVADAAYEALSPTPRAQPGPHCNTCAGRAKCPALRDSAHQAASMQALPDAPDMEYAEHELALLQHHAGLLNAYVSGLSLEVEHALRNGKRSQLFELRRTAGKFEWIPEQVAQVRALAQLMGHNIDAAPALITPTQARAKLGPVVDMYARRSPATVKLAPLTPASKLFPSSE